MILLLLFLTPAQVFCQKIDGQWLYVKALDVHFASNVSKPAERKVIKKEEIFNTLPSLINHIRIDLIDPENLSQYFNTDNSFVATSLFPIEIYGDELEIRAIDYRIIKSDSGASFVFTGGTKCCFKFDCNKRGYVYYKKVKLQF
jgi:hypothetical protein